MLAALLYSTRKHPFPGGETDAILLDVSHLPKVQIQVYRPSVRLIRPDSGRFWLHAPGNRGTLADMRQQRKCFDIRAWYLLKVKSDWRGEEAGGRRLETGGRNTQGAWHISVAFPRQSTSRRKLQPPVSSLRPWSGDSGSSGSPESCSFHFESSTRCGLSSFFRRGQSFDGFTSPYSSRLSRQRVASPLSNSGVRTSKKVLL